MSDAPKVTPITPVKQEASGIPVQVAAWIGAGAVLHVHNLDGTETTDPVAVSPGTLVLMVPAPTGAQLAQALGVIPRAGTIIAPRGPAH